MLPIVMGPSTENYKEKLPPNSFIHVDNFTGPEDLVSYIKVLDHDDKIYRFDVRWFVELPKRLNWCNASMFEGKFNNLFGTFSVGGGNTGYWLERRCFKFGKRTMHCD